MGKQFAALTSTLPAHSTTNVLTPGIYLKLHKKAHSQRERVEHRWRPTIRRVVLEQCIMRSKLWHKTIMSMAPMEFCTCVIGGHASPPHRPSASPLNMRPTLSRPFAFLDFVYNIPRFGDTNLFKLPL